VTGFVGAAVKVSLVALSILSILSLGGLVLFTWLPLIVAIAFVGRGSGLVERIGWIALASLMAAQWAWMVAYLGSGGVTPMTTIIVLSTAAATALALGGWFERANRRVAGPT
jgi:hypothetical protein